MNNKVIVAPLNWGLGHASRCVPIIHFLLKNKFTPIIASDGGALTFLQKEFPDLEFLELPSYKILYTKNLKLGLLFQVPKVFEAIKKEKAFITDFITKNKEVVGIISDNRFGVRSNKIPSVYITHQLNVLSGFFTFLTSKLHQFYIKKFDECWVPDSKDHSLSGELSAVNNSNLKVKFIGPLSRFIKMSSSIKNDVLIVLSGVESQRVSLERKLLKIFKNSTKKIVLVQGKVEKNKTKTIKNRITIYNYLLSTELEKEMNQSELIICRSGYSSIMDLAVLEKKAFLIPTKNQSEQEYLAVLLKANNLAPFTSEESFTIQDLKNVKNYKGLYCNRTDLDKELLSLF